MLNRPQLPRTLIGAGGARLIDMPGITYPDEVLHGHMRTGRTVGDALLEPPEGWVSSQEAAEMMGITPRSARAFLGRARAQRVRVTLPRRVGCIYWNRLEVLELMNKRKPMLVNIPDKLCNSVEACYILMIARSTLHRYVRQGLLREQQVRHVSAAGVRNEAYYLRSEVKHLAARRNAIRARCEAARLKRRQRDWAEYRLRKSGSE